MPPRRRARPSPSPRRRPAVLAASLAACTALAACGDSGGGRPAAAGDGPLRLVGQFEVHSLEPAQGDGFFTRLEVAETLVDSDLDGTLVPELASGWDVSPDGLRWTFRLVPDVTFHDGTPLTPAAVVASLEAVRDDPSVPLASAPVASVAAAGDDAVVVTRSEPCEPLAAALAHTSAQVLAPAAYAADGTVATVVGTGPYRVTRFEPPATVEVEAFADWRGEPPAVRQVAYQAVGRAESRSLMASSAQADVVLGLDPVARQRVEGRDGVTLHTVTLPRSILLKVNAGHPVLGDVRVRLALSAALDRTAMSAALLRDEDMAATQLFPPSLPDWHSEDLPPLEHDPARARDLLRQAGFAPGPDGVLTRDGRPLSLTLRTYPDRAELPVLATAIQAALREVGVAVDVQVGNSSEISAGHADGSLDLALYARNFALVPDPLATMLTDFADGGADFGPMNWRDDRLTAALDDLADGADDDAAAAARRAEVAQVLQEELPLVPVAWYTQGAATSERVEGFELDPLERSWRMSTLRWAP